ncbi:MAG: alpha-L-rhamnosidase N-terminal domain-containing protein, partial [Candidatus Brocadiaceae bacterium]
MTEARAEGPQQPANLRCEYLRNPMGIETPRPRLSWWVSDDRRGAVQSAYRILVASDPELLEEGRGDVWDSGKVASDRSIQVEYDGPELRSRQCCWWKLRTWDADDTPSPWSEAARWEMGLLRAEDWSAEWIGMPREEATEAATYLRRAFELDGPVVRARAYATALGVYELRLNGQKVGDHVFPPGWTDYKKRVMYQTYDVTEMLREGENALGAIVGDGWYCGRLGWGEKPEEGRFGGRPPRFLLQLEVEFEDGTSCRTVTDGSWRRSAGPILRSDFYDGERYDARLEMPGWDAPAYAADWQPVAVFGDPGIVRNAQQDPPIRVTEEFQPVSVEEASPGVH